MKNSYDVAHGLSQDAPGPLEPVELAPQDDTLARTGNTARDQEMYAAGIRTGEENAKHNAAIRAGAGWLPIESAPKDGQSILGRGPRQDTVVIAWDEWAQPEARWKAVHLDVNGYECPEIVLRGEPTLWQPMPAPPCPTCNDQGAVGNILTAQPCPDCAAPGVSTVEADAVKRLRDAIEGECGGTWISEKQAIAVLTHLGGNASAAGDALDLTLAQKYEDACILANANARDAARWRAYAAQFPEISDAFLAVHAVDGGNPLPTIKGASITGGYVVVTPAGWDADKATKLRDAILRLFPVNPVHTPRPSDELAAQRKGDA